MILALELSSRRGSVALVSETAVIEERVWEDPAARHLALWSHLPRLIRAHGVTWPVLRAIAVGRGPGSFSGLRAGIVAARMLAAPDALPVVAMSSGEALARAWYFRHPAARHPLAIAGDARRGAIWLAVFARRDPGVSRLLDWTLTPASNGPDLLPPDTRILTSDRTRLLAACPAAACNLVEDPDEDYPSAAFVGRIAYDLICAQRSGEPVEPLYLHEPV